MYMYHQKKTIHKIHCILHLKTVKKRSKEKWTLNVYKRVCLSMTMLTVIMWNFQVQDKQKKIVSFTNELEEIEDRVHAMSEHLKNVRQELTHTQVGIIYI